MNKYRNSLVLSIFTLLFIVLSPLSAQENPPVEPSPSTSTEEGGGTAETNSEEETTWALFTFAELNFGNKVLEQPDFAGNYTINIPAHWALAEGTGLYLEMQPFVRQNGLVVSENLYGGTVIVKFEGAVLVEQIVNSNEKVTLDLRIPAELLEDDGRGAYSLEIDLETDFNCGNPHSTSLQILDSSYISMAYKEVLPITDLRLLPFPIQQNSIQPNLGTFVIPDNISEEEAIGLLTTASGMGRMSNRISFDLINESQLTDEIKATSHLIFVGNYMDFLSTEMIFNSEDLALLDSVGDDEGFLKLTNSPWDSSKVILHVGGSTPVGIEKAANALAYGTIRPATDRFDFAVIEEVVFEEPLPDAIFSSEFAFSDLGYDVRTIFGPQEAQISYDFEIPTQRPFTLEDTGTINILFNHSDLIDYEASGFNIFLNNQPIGSSHFSKETTQITNLTIDVPSSFLRSGINSLTIQANLEPLAPCSRFADDATWVNIFPESTVSLPLTFIDEPVNKITPFIRSYPLPFSSSNDLGTTTFIIPENNLNALFGALQIAFDLGKQVSGEVLQMDVLFSHNVSEADLIENHIIVVGQAIDHPFIDTINEWLPGPFVENSNQIVSDRLPVEYRLPEDDSLGYLQMIPSPWDEGLFILLVTGSDAEGVQNATSVLLNNRRALNGDLVVIDQNGAFSTVTPTEIVAEENEEETAVYDSEDIQSSEETEAVDSATETPTAEDTEMEAPEADAPSHNIEASVESVEESAETPEQNESVEESAVSNNNNADSTSTVPQRAVRGTERFSQSSLPVLPILVITTGTIALLLMGGFYLYNRREQ